MVTDAGIQVLITKHIIKKQHALLMTSPQILKNCFLAKTHLNMLLGLDSSVLKAHTAFNTGT